MPTPSPEVVAAYTALLEQAILDLRMRVRYNDGVTLDEVHDFLDALHNVPIMLRRYGGWHVEENIDWHLAHYDEKWMGRPGSELRRSLMETLKRARAGEFDRSSGGGLPNTALDRGHNGPRESNAGRRPRPLNVGPLGVEIQMPMLFDIVVAATDFLGHQQQYEMTVIAADDSELRDEINAFFSLRDAIDTWNIVSTIDSRPLLEHDAHAIAYRDRGPHSYISQ